MAFSRWLGHALLVLSCSCCCFAQFGIQPSSAKRREDADIFLSGALTTANNARNVYQWDIKAEYPKYKGNPSTKGRSLFWSPLIDFVANKGTDANPDKARFTNRIGLNFDLTPASVPGQPAQRRPWLTDFQLVNETGGEFDREFISKGFISTNYARLLFPGFGLAKSGVNWKRGTRFVPLFDIGVEVGHNYANKLQKQGSGSVGRVFGSLSVYQELGTERLALVGLYQVRKPMTDEVFQRKLTPRGDPQLSLTSKPRHYVEFGLDWSPSESLSYLTVKPKYRYGSLPPAFNFLEHQFSVSLEFRADVKK